MTASLTTSGQPDEKSSSTIAALVLSGLKRVLLLLTAVAVLFSLLGFLGRLWWPLELMCHFRVQYALFLATGALPLWWFKQRQCAVVAGVAAGINLATVLPLYWPRPTADTDGRSFRIMSANVQTSNRAYQRLLDAVEAYNPDIFLVMETDHDWAQALSRLHGEYPHSHMEPRRGSFGMMLFSRYPLRDIMTTALGGVDTPAISATVATPVGDVGIVGVHPMPPMGAGNAHLRNRQLAHAAEIARAQTAPVIVIGDLNATPWSPQFGDLLREAGLTDARNGFGAQPTWPVFSAFWALQIPIDHCLVGDGLRASNFVTGPDIGSDHLPIVVDVSTHERNSLAHSQ